MLQRAWQAFRRGELGAARAACEQALQLDPGAFDGWRVLAVVAGAAGDAAVSEEALRKAHALRPDDAATAFEYGSLLLERGDAAAAQPLLRDALQALPGEPVAAFRHATACFLLAEYAEAARGFELATARKQDWVEAWNNLAAAHGKLQDYPPAIAAARVALRLRPDDATTNRALAALLSNLFDQPSLQEGLQFADRATRIEPDFAEAHRDKAILLRKLGLHDRALASARHALQLLPLDAMNVDVLGQQLLLMGKPQEACDVYRGAMSAGIDTQLIERQYGVALLHCGASGDSHQALASALRRDPTDQPAIAYLGAALAADGRLEAASDLLGLHRHVHAIELPTPVGFQSSHAFHRALAEDIRRHSQQRWEPPGLAARQAYLGGDLLADRTAAIIGFEQRLREAIDGFCLACRTASRDTAQGDAFLRNVPDRYRMHVWATLAAEHGYIDTHFHEGSWLSGAYYVELPPAIAPDDPHHAGWIEFGRPFGTLPQWPEAALRRVCPRVGTLLLFPSYLFHRTLPYRGDGERISISFDLAAA